MVCIQCYLPPILFMIYMRFINPILAPYIMPTINKVLTYFWGPQAAVQADATAGCPIRPSTSRGAANKKTEESEAGGDKQSSPSSNKPKDD